MIAAFGPKMLSLAGEEGDGWIPFAHIPETYRRSLEGAITRAAEAKERDLSHFRASLVLPVALSEESENAANAVMKVVKSWLVWSPDNLTMVAPEIKHPGRRQPYLKTGRREDFQMLADLARKIPDRPALEMSVLGTPDDCVAQLERFTKAGCRNFLLAFIPVNGQPFRQAAGVFASQVLPRIKEF